MIEVIQSQNPLIKPKSIGHLVNKNSNKSTRIIWRLVLFIWIVTIPILIAWFAYEKITKKEYLKGYYLYFGKSKYSIDKNEIKIEELTSENGNTLLGTVAGGVLFGGVGALGGAIIGSKKSGLFITTDNSGYKTLIKVKGTSRVNKLREYAFINQVFS